MPELADDGLDREDERESGIDYRRIIKFVLSVAMKTGLLLVFHVLGWLKLAPVVSDWGGWGVVATAAMLAVVVSALVAVGLALFTFAFMVTCGFAIVLLPLAGYFLMEALLVVAPQFVTAPNEHWFVLVLLGSSLLLASVPMKRLRKPASQTQGDRRVIDGER